MDLIQLSQEISMNNENKLFKENLIDDLDLKMNKEYQFDLNIQIL